MVSLRPSRAGFAPGLVLAAMVWGSAMVVFLLVGPGLGAWADTLLTACFGWNAEARRYRLDALLLALLQPPLFVAVVGLFYADELRAFLRRVARSQPPLPWPRRSSSGRRAGSSRPPRSPRRGASEPGGASCADPGRIAGPGVLADRPPRGARDGRDAARDTGRC